MLRFGWECAVAFVVGLLLNAVFLWKFLPYSVRERSPGLLPVWTLPLIATLATFVLTSINQRDRKSVPLALVAGMFVANACLIVVDCSADPTNHNLWPFEFVIIGFAAGVPALLGSWLSFVLRRNR